MVCCLGAAPAARVTVGWPAGPTLTGGFPGSWGSEWAVPPGVLVVRVGGGVAERGPLPPGHSRLGEVQELPGQRAARLPPTMRSLQARGDPEDQLWDRAWVECPKLSPFPDGQLGGAVSSVPAPVHLGPSLPRLAFQDEASALGCRLLLCLHPETSGSSGHLPCR